jgi:hypothetical protein
MGPIGYHETSVINSQYMLPKTQKRKDLTYVATEA